MILTENTNTAPNMYCICTCGRIQEIKPPSEYFSSAVPSTEKVDDIQWTKLISSTDFTTRNMGD